MAVNVILAVGTVQLQSGLHIIADLIRWTVAEQAFLLQTNRQEHTECVVSQRDKPRRICAFRDKFVSPVRRRIHGMPQLEGRSPGIDAKVPLHLFCHGWRFRFANIDCSRWPVRPSLLSVSNSR